MNIKTIKPGMNLSVLQATMISAMKRKPTTRTIVDAAAARYFYLKSMNKYPSMRSVLFELTGEVNPSCYVSLTIAINRMMTEMKANGEARLGDTRKENEGRPRTVTPEMEEQMRKMVTEMGKTRAEIAKQMGVSLATTYNYTKA